MTLSRRVRIAPALLVAGAALRAATGCGGSGGGPSTSALVVVTTEALPHAVVGRAYSASVLASGPHDPLTWIVAGGRLPPGLSLDAGTGEISGYPRTAARFHLNVEVRDGADAAGARDASFAAARRGFDLEVEPGPPVVLPLPCPIAEYGAPYQHPFVAVGGEAPYHFELSGGSLPTGLEVMPGGTILGIPAAPAGSWHPVVRATDAVGSVAERDFKLRLVVLPLVLATTTLPDAARGFPYAALPEARPSGGGGPFVWSIEPSPSALPPGLAIDRGSGRITGTATSAGAFAFTLVVRDAALQRATRDLSIRVNPGPVLAAVTPGTPPIGPGPVTLTGQGFQPGMTVTFGLATPTPADVLDATRATVVPPKSPVQSGTVSVAIENPDGGVFAKAGAFRYPFATVDFVAQGVKGGSRDHSRGIAAGDVNGDGLDDLAHVGASGIELIRPNGPTYTNVWTTKVVRGDGSFNDVRLADVDADGDLDLVASRSSTTDSIEVYRNDGAGAFPATASVVTVYPRPSSFHFPYALATGDFDGDGVVDVAFTSGHGNQGVVYLYRGLGDGSFVEAHVADGTIYDAHGGCCQPSSIALADLDGDGRDDVVVTDSFPSACASGQSCPTTPGTNLHPGGNDFVAWVSLSPSSGSGRTWHVVRVDGANGRLDGDNTGLAVYDHDGDGKTDLAVFGGYLSQRGMGVAWLTGDGAGGFSERFTRPTTYNRRFGARIDANGDGFEDLILVGGDATAASGLGNGWSVAECWLGGTSEVPAKAWVSGGEFAAGGSIPGANPGRVVVGDFDGDGRDDFAVSQSFHAKERYANGQDDGPVEGVAVYLNRSR